MSFAPDSKQGRDHVRQHGERQDEDQRLEELMRHEFAQLSTQSENDNGQGSRRKLLLIYIHGFFGSEESFRSFPAHVHSLLAILLHETHVVHSKIYPRYRSRDHIQVARDEFSRWLRPHEAATTDVVLLGHSMGGLVAGEIVLMPAPNGSNEVFQHRILGILNFDVPFLGMHPGVVKSGLSSIFSPSKEPEDKYESRSIADHAMAQFSDTAVQRSTRVLDSDDSSFWDSQDSNFNAAYTNDVVLPVRKFWQSVAHFVHKHSSDITGATSNMVHSHFQFMSAMSNGQELRERYVKLRVLEEDDARRRQTTLKSRHAPPRVRFSNYYTVSTGRPKPVEQPPTSPNDEAPKSTAETIKQEESTKLEATEPAIAGVLDKQEQIVPPIEVTPAVSDKASSAPSIRSQHSGSSSPKPRKEGTFCTLPPKDAQRNRDPMWVRMFMEDVDEVGAHCGMFFVDERYERFVGDVASRIEDWVKHDLSVRAAMGVYHVD